MDTILRYGRRLESSDFIPKSNSDIGYLIADDFFGVTLTTSTFGYTTLGTSGELNLDSTTVAAGRFTVPNDCTIVDYVSAYLRLEAAGTCPVSCAIFTNAGGDTIGTEIGRQTSAVNLTSTSNTQIDVPCNIDLTAYQGQDVWLFVWCDSSSTGNAWHVPYDLNAVTNTIYISWANSYNDWSTVPNTPNEAYDLAYPSIWATYQVASSPTNVNTGLGEVVYSGLAPTVSVSNNQNITTDLGVVTYNGFSPTIQNDVNIQSGLGQVTYNGLSPTINISVNITTQLGQVQYNGFEPSISVSVNVATGLGQVVYNGFSPTIENNVNVTTNLGQVTFNGFSPTIQNDQNITTGLGELTFNGFSPLVSTDNQIVTLTGQVVFNGFAPIVGLTGRVTTALGQVNYNGFSPIIENDNNIQTGLGVALYSGYAPTIAIVPPRRRLIIVT